MTPAARVQRVEGTTLWRQIADTLALEIAAGRLNEKLPNEPHLAARFGVNRHTVRHALRVLADRGLVEVVHGRGTYVRSETLDYEIGRRSRLAHSLQRARRLGRSELGDVAREQPPEEVRLALEIPAGAEVLRIESLDVVDGRTLGVCTQYFPMPRFDGIADHYRATGNTQQALAAMGVQAFTRRVSRVSARACTPELATRLRQPRAQPILHVETVYVDEHGRPIEFGISRFAAAAVQVVVEP